MKEKIDLSDDIALVTGAAGGIGSAVAEELAKEGATTVVTDISEEGTAVASEPRRDVQRDGSVQTAQRQRLRRLRVGHRRRGRGVREHRRACQRRRRRVRDHGSLTAFHETTPDDWPVQFDVTFRGPVNTTHAAIQHMKEQESGAIVNFISEAHKGQERGDDKLYASAKGGSPCSRRRSHARWANSVSASTASRRRRHTRPRRPNSSRSMATGC